MQTPHLTNYTRISFYFQAEDGIRDLTVTGVQTCALPISRLSRRETSAHLATRCGKVTATSTRLLDLVVTNDIKICFGNARTTITEGNKGLSSQVAGQWHHPTISVMSSAGVAPLSSATLA